MPATAADWPFPNNNKLSHMFWYLAVRSFIFALSSIAPLALIYITWQHLLPLMRVPLPPLALQLPIALELWLWAELVFLLCFLWTKRRLEHLHPHGAPANDLTHEQRCLLFRRCLDSVEDKRRYVEGWFLGAPLASIRRENLNDFIVWSMFGSDYSELQRRAAVAEQRLNCTEDMPEVERKKWQADVDRMLEFQSLFDIAEEALQIRIPSGRNPDIRCMRLNQDPVNPLHRPLIYYVVLLTLQTAFDCYLHFGLGFRKYTANKEQSLLSRWDIRHRKRSSHAKTPYWHLPARTTNTQHEPIVFVHGIGVGLFGYIKTLRALVQAARTEPRAIFAVELPHVSSLLFPFYAAMAEDVPTAAETVQTLEAMLKRHCDGQPATFIGHSLGSAVVSWVLKLGPQLVHRAVLIDPICFMLHLPDLAYNFIYRQPKTTVEWVLWWFASRELYISWTLARCFHWHENALFVEDMPKNTAVTVILCGEDAVVPAKRVREHVLGFGGTVEVYHDGPVQDVVVSEHKRLFLHYFSQRNHAEFLLDPDMEQLVVHMILEDPLTTRRRRTLSTESDSGPVQMTNTVMLKQPTTGAMAAEHAQVIQKRLGAQSECSREDRTSSHAVLRKHIREISNE